MPIGSLGPCLRSIRPSMQFKILTSTTPFEGTYEFTMPTHQILSSIRPFLNFLKKFINRSTSSTTILKERNYPILTLGSRPMVSLTPLHRRNFSNIWAIGPPPPSPFPKTRRDVVSSVRFLCCVTERMRSPTLACALYVSEGHI